MKQQQVHSDESTAYTTGYGEVPHTHEYFLDLTRARNFLHMNTR